MAGKNTFYGTNSGTKSDQGILVRDDDSIYYGKMKKRKKTHIFYPYTTYTGSVGIVVQPDKDIHDDIPIVKQTLSDWYKQNEVDIVESICRDEIDKYTYDTIMANECDILLFFIDHQYDKIRGLATLKIIENGYEILTICSEEHTTWIGRIYL